MEKGIVIASFGTTHKDTRIKAISNIERSINTICREKSIYSLRAFTSRIVKKRIWENEGLYVFNEIEAIEQLKDRGIKEENIYIQPLHLLPGFEYEKLRSIKCKHLGVPLFSSLEDVRKFVEKVPFEVEKEEVLILFGHGTDHANDRIYEDLQKEFHLSGKKNIYVVCVEGNHSLEVSLEKILSHHPKKVILQPLMIVAGDHAKNDMDSMEEGSLRKELDKEGLIVESRLIGLGEVPEVVELFNEKVKDLIYNNKQILGINSYIK